VIKNSLARHMITRKFNQINTSSLVKQLPKFKQNNPNSNVALGIGASIMTTGIIYLCVDFDSDDDVKKRIKRTYAYVVSGLGLTGASAYGFYKLGFHQVVLRTNKWVHLSVSLVTSISMLMGTMLTDYYESPIIKHICWTGFNIVMAGSLCTVSIYGGPLIAQAGLATAGIMTGLSLISANSDPNSVNQLEKPLGIGLGALVACGLGHMIFPMPILYNISLYGGLVVFSGLTITDTSKVIQHAKNSKYDPINESFSLYLDYINLFLRILEVMYKLNNSKK
jgi:FtsH-binding integral membrane protein